MSENRSESGLPRRPSMKDVASAVGVSWTTVSNVVNHKGRVGPATRRKVEHAIAELGYRPNIAGRQLRQGRARILSLAVPEIDSPDFSRLAHETIDAAADCGYNVLIHETLGAPDAERLVARGFHVNLIDGIIFSPVRLSLTEIDQLRGPAPLVVLGATQLSIDDRARLSIDQVAIDETAATRDATRHLLLSGRKQIGYLGTMPEPTPQTPRIRGFYQEHHSAAKPVCQESILHADSATHHAGAQAIETALPQFRKIDGLVCENDQLALGAMYALRANGIRVPEDVGVVGWGNTVDGRYSNPSLTTVAPDVRGIAQEAVGRLISRVDGTAVTGEHVCVSHRLLVRESSGITK